MRVIPKLPTLSLALTVLAGCADGPPAPTGADAAPPEATLSLTDATTGTEIELRRPKVDVTDWTDESTTVPVHLVTPEAARNIGPGSAIIITIPDEGRFGCTANFVWRQGSKLYLGAAGHCFLPGDKKATHGAGADYDASGVTVQVCVENCEGNFRTALLVGKLVTLGKVAYARQTDPTGTEDVGNDFGVVEIPREAASLVRPEMPVWGGPRGVDVLEAGEFGCHYGNGLVFGETFLTKARVGVGGGSDEDFWMGDFAGSFGDSGSALNGCESDGLGFHGTGAVGVLTHLGLAVCPCDVNFKHLWVKAEHGVFFGTTVRRAKEMATEAGLNLSIVEP
ncbi:MAG: hypothetical protein M3282_02540 [Gemmatimonadota bacterium]|nr:hypothetical protein [Gemmatimonadota bacterium]